MEENTIVNEVAFGETSNGAAMVQGSFVGQGASMYLNFTRVRAALTHIQRARG